MSSQDYQYDEGGGEFPPYKEDYFQRITAVSWTTSLAVEFSKGAYSGVSPNLRLGRATVSFWFRVPSEVVSAVKQPTSYWDYQVLMGVIPLVALTRQHDGPIYDNTGPSIGTYWKQTNIGTWEPFTLYGDNAIERQTPMSPTVIGVQVAYPADGTIRLFVHLQTSDTGHGQNTIHGQTGFTPTMRDLGAPYGVKPVEPLTIHYDDMSYASSKLEFFESDSQPGVGINVSPDTWHHLLMSWDLRTDSSHGDITGEGLPTGTYIDSFSKLYCAFDDVNKTTSDLPIAWPYGGLPDSNGMVCDGCVQVAGEYSPPSAPDYTGTPQFSVTFSQGIVADGIFVPSQPHYERGSGPPGGGPSDAGTSIDPLQKIEIAELQIFANVLLDTSNVSNRRAFIDAKGKPVDPKQAQKLLGKKPEILLHGSGNWIKGKNTGSDGQFTPSGTIKRYTPDPQLGK